MTGKRRNILLLVFGSLVVALTISFLLSSARESQNFFDGDWHAFRAHWNMDRLADGDFSYYDNTPALFGGSDYIAAVRLLDTRSEVIGIGNFDRRGIPREYREYLVYTFEVLAIYRQNNPNFEIAAGDIIDVVDAHGNNLFYDAELLLFMMYFVSEAGNHQSTMFFLTNAVQSAYFYETLTSISLQNELNITRSDLTGE